MLWGPPCSNVGYELACYKRVQTPFGLLTDAKGGSDKCSLAIAIRAPSERGSVADMLSGTAVVVMDKEKL